MPTTSRTILIAAMSIFPFVPAAQSGSSKPATYITKEEVDTVAKQPGGDRQIKIVDVGPENYAVGIVHRGATGTSGAGGAGVPAGARGAEAGGARGAQPPAEPCGEKSSAPVPTGTPNGLTHDQQTEGYLIVSGGGTMVTGGHLVNGRRSAPDSAVTKELNGPSCSGPVVGADAVTPEVKVGDIVIIPAGTPHGWVSIPDHVDYLSFRPSARVIPAGYVHPSLKK